NVKECNGKAGIGSKPFPGTFMKPIKKDVDLPTEVLELLVEYYHTAYEYAFATVSNIHTSSEDSIIILSKVNQFNKLRVGAEVFGLTHSPRYIKSANVLSQFVIDGNIIDIYSRQVQFFFEHTIQLLEGSAIHSLAFVRWYDKADDHRNQFHCQIGNDDEKICNIELCKRDFYELSRDCIIPIHSILGRFIAGTMKIGKKNPKEYLSVIPINKKIHI